MNHRVLVVEDNLPNSELLRDWLEVEGFEVWTAADLKASFEILTKWVPDVVLLDIKLGHEDGLDIVAWMRKEPKMRQVPVIAVTAHAKVIEQQRVLQAGYKACLSKPIDFKQLRDQLEFWLSNSARTADVQ